jgi:hypothetical protein
LVQAAPPTNVPKGVPDDVPITFRDKSLSKAP